MLDYLVDPVLRAPTIGSLLMCLASALVGVLVFIRKRSLLGEALSHASYPGVVSSVLVFSLIFPSEEVFSIGILVGAFVSALLGLWIIDLLETKLKVKNDAALCFVLSVFFGVGVLIASRVQFTHALWYKQIQVFLYGQAATMTDVHILLYGLLCLLTGVLLFIFYRPLQILNFDRAFATTLRMKVRLIDAIIYILLVLAIVIGIRSVGVVLMSGMLIAPAVAARQFTNRLSHLFIYAGIIGMASGFLGNYFSVEIPLFFKQRGYEGRFTLPTGPMILLCASFFAFSSLLLAPKRGLLSRYLRIVKFKSQCRLENALKAFWKKGRGASLTFSEMAKTQDAHRFSFYLLLNKLRRQGWIEKTEKNRYCLTPGGWLRASHIIRVHRLWEVYLVYLGQGKEKVHGSAEEMEHIITPEIEKELTELLQDPRKDPHEQPIPAKEGL